LRGDTDWTGGTVESGGEGGLQLVVALGVLLAPLLTQELHLVGKKLLHVIGTGAHRKPRS
jgi:hypothetical protein